jgi:hypothetical protein
MPVVARRKTARGVGCMGIAFLDGDVRGIEVNPTQFPPPNRSPSADILGAATPPP